MNRVIAELVFAILLLVLGAIGGYAYKQHQGDQALGTAQGDVRVCVAAAEAQHLAVTEAQAAYADLKARHDKILRDGEQAIADRDAEIGSLQRDAEASRTAITELGHEDPDCAELARLPVCAAVADRLWPPAAAADSAHAP
jgi:hypothetical protein